MQLYLQSLGKPFIKNVKSARAFCDPGFTRFNRRFTEFNRGSVTGLIAAGSKQQELLHTNEKTHSHCIVTTLSASLVFGQASSATPTAQIVANLVQRLTALLTLTTAQQTQATTIFTTGQTALSTLNTSMQTAQTAPQTAIKANDLTGIVTQATQIGNLTTQRVEDEAKADAAFYAILTADQPTKRL